MERRKVEAAVSDLLRETGEVRSGILAARLGVSRYTAHSELRRLVEAGLLERSGFGRGSRYARRSSWAFKRTWPREGLEENRVWNEAEHVIDASGATPDVIYMLHFAVTEIVNNAIDHSSGKAVTLRASEHGNLVSFEVEDDGVGIFEHVLASRGLKSPYEAIAELQKGKVTTMPDQHSGQGIFFTSKVADRMNIEGGHTRWMIDTTGRDQSVETTPGRRGTLVHFTIAKDADRTLEGVFQAFSESGTVNFNRTRTTVKLFREGAEIVSRSEAKRLLAGLEKFAIVELDFRDVRGVGQGFADEVFRVWQSRHPNVTLIVQNANSAVQYMIDRARSSPAEGFADTQARFALVESVPTVRITVGGSTQTGAPRDASGEVGSSELTRPPE